MSDNEELVTTFEAFSPSFLPESDERLDDEDSAPEGPVEFPTDDAVDDLTAKLAETERELASVKADFAALLERSSRRAARDTSEDDDPTQPLLAEIESLKAEIEKLKADQLGALEALRDDLTTEMLGEIARLLTEHLEEIEQLKTAHAEEIDGLNEQLHVASAELGDAKVTIETLEDRVAEFEPRFARLTNATVWEVTWASTRLWVVADSIEEAIRKTKYDHPSAEISGVKAAGIKLVF